MELGARGRCRQDPAGELRMGSARHASAPAHARTARRRTRVDGCVSPSRSASMRGRGRNMLYRIAPTGDAELVEEDIGGDPAYGLTELPDGDLLVAEWSGRLLRVNLATRSVSTYTELPARVYQIASDGTGIVYAASYDGHLLRIEPDGEFTVIPTGFGARRFVALTA